MALPATRDIELYRGDVYGHEFTFTDENNDPLDLSAFTVAAHWRSREDATTYVAFAVDTSNAATGVIVISLTPAQTAVLKAGVYDVQITDDDEPETLIRGKVKVTKDVTRP